MSLFSTFDISGSALSAQSVRLNTVASNLANAETAASSPEETYRSRAPVFKTLFNDAMGAQKPMGVSVSDIYESEASPRQQFQPEHPLAGVVRLVNITDRPADFYNYNIIIII